MIVSLFPVNAIWVNSYFPAAEALRWRKAIEGMREDGSLARILKQYDYQAP